MRPRSRGRRNGSGPRLQELAAQLRNLRGRACELDDEFGDQPMAYRAVETLLADGKVRAIGVSNFTVEHLTALLPRCTVVPAVNQIEFRPYFAQHEVQEFGHARGILTQAWSPIGGITFYRDGSHGSTIDDTVIGAIAQAHGKSPAQVMLRWGLQEGRSVIPKSTKPSRMRFRGRPGPARTGPAGLPSPGCRRSDQQRRTGLP